MLVRRAGILGALLALALAAQARAEAAWVLSTQSERNDAQVYLDDFESALNARDSATATLQAWCDAQPGMGGARIVAQRVLGPGKPADASVRQALGADEATLIAYRRVRLSCGPYVLSEADNWYRPDRLTPQMNRALEETQMPFGVVVGPLNFTRRRLSQDMLFLPMLRTEGEAEAIEVPAEVIRHRALLLDSEGRPFSLVIETYTDQVLKGMPAPPGR